MTTQRHASAPVSSDIDTARAVWTTAYQNDLDDGCFAYVAPGGHKDASGKTTPRSLRHLPYMNKDGQIDAPHLRNALARLPQTDIPAAAKASALKKLVAAAKKVGIDVSNDVSGGGNDSGRAQQEPTTLRAVGGDDLVEHVFTAPITRVDPERRLVTVTGTSEAKDSFRTRFDYEASKDAFTRWIGNVREMHQPKAVGTRVAVNCDDDNRRIEATIRISKGAQDTWEKILDGTLKGASIGASNVVWEQKRDSDSNEVVPVARKYDLVELSLVDNPSNPDCLGIAVMRNAVPDEFLLDEMTDAAVADATRAGATGGADPSAAALDASRPDAHDLLAHPTDSAADRPVTDTAVMGAQADGGDAEDFDPMLREVNLDGAGAVSPMGNSAGEVDEQLHELNAPPEDPSAATFAASRPQGVIGSQVASRSLSDRVASLAQQSAGGVASEPTPTAMEPASSFATVDRMRAPFGAGAPLSPAQGQLPSKRQLRDAKKSAQATAEEEIRAAGDAAEATVAPWSVASGEDYTAYILRKSRARGAIERAVIERQQLARVQALQEAQPEHGAAQAVRASAWSAPRSQQATQTAQRMATATAAASATAVANSGVSSTPASAPVAPVAPVIEERALPVGASGAPFVAVAALPVAGGQNANQNAEPGNGRQLHLHSHAHDSGMLHSHEHAHTHSNGTTHSHPHGHDHFHEDNHPSSSQRAADSAQGGQSGGHAHEHSHDHGHSHTYRDGAPLDSALLLLPEYARAGGANTNDRAPMKLGPEAPAAALSSLKPVSGSAQSAVNGKPRSPQMSVQPAAVGHLDLLNTEDENAVGFGVPEEVEPVATPEDGQVTAPVGFHEGGHSPEGGAGAPLNPQNKDFVIETAPQKTAELPHGRAAAASTRKPAKSVDDGKPAEAPEDAGKMDDDLDYDGDEDEQESKTAGGRGAQDAEETRVGARISEESRGALHAARDQMLSSVRALCAHCGCENCAATTDALDAAAAHAEAFAAGPERMTQMTTALGEQRLLAGLIAQAVAAEVARAQEVTRQETAQALAAAFEQTLEQTLAPVLTRLADLELTLADAQRGQRAETERALAEHTQRLNAVPNEHWDAARAETTTRLAALDQRLEAVAEDASGLKAAVDSMYGLVERIAQQPLDVVGPAQFAIDKRFALTDEGTLQGQSGGASSNALNSGVAQQIKTLQDLARQTSDPQLQMRYAQEVARLEAQGGGSNRRMLGQGRAPLMPTRR